MAPAIAELRAPPPSPTEVRRSQANFGPRTAVLNLAFPREDKVEVSGGPVYSPFSSLVEFWGYQGDVHYHLNHRHAIKLISFAKVDAKLSGFVVDELRGPFSRGESLNTTIEIPRTIIGAGYSFSPYYSKMHLGGATVLHFDVFTSTGINLVKSEIWDLNEAVQSSQTRPAAALGLGFRFLLPSRWALRAELKDDIMQLENFGEKGFSHQMNISLSLSMFFGSF